MSHPQALAQTDTYLRAAGIETVAAYDTAGSAKLVREQNLRDTAAIASARAAEVHGLEVLDFRQAEYQFHLPLASAPPSLESH